jgi:hypothetical protein
LKGFQEEGHDQGGQVGQVRQAERADAQRLAEDFVSGFFYLEK